MLFIISKCRNPHSPCYEVYKRGYLVLIALPAVIHCGYFEYVLAPFPYPHPCVLLFSSPSFGSLPELVFARFSRFHESLRCLNYSVAIMYWNRKLVVAQALKCRLFTLGRNVIKIPKFSVRYVQQPILSATWGWEKTIPKQNATQTNRTGEA